jgi:hypothetical protein
MPIETRHLAASGVRRPVAGGRWPVAVLGGWRLASAVHSGMVMSDFRQT